MKFRLLPYETNSAYRNMAIDRSLYESLVQGTILPTIRFYAWKNPSVSIGHGQDTAIVDRHYCITNNIDIVRRPSMGNAVYHHINDITYSIVMPTNLDLRQTYKTICGWIVNALIKIGIDAKFVGENDIVFDGRKIVGSAQRNFNPADLKKRVTLQHGSIFYSATSEDWRKAFNLDDEEKKKIGGIKGVNYICDRQKLLEELVKAFSKNEIVSEIVVGSLSETELQRIKILEEKYKKDVENPSDSKIKEGTACAIHIKND